MKTKVKTYKGYSAMRQGIWWMSHRGWNVVGNVSCAKRFLRSPLYTVTFEKERS